MESRFLMGRKKLFSLIEIAVAMAVASIGVAAIMALLPLAVKSSSDSIGDTLATDAANTVIARIDEMILKDFDVARNLPAYQTSASSAASFHKNKNNYKEVTEMPPISGEESYIFESAGSNGHYHFFFGPKGEKSDFGADVWVWRDDSVKVTKLDGTTKLKQLTKASSELKQTRSGKLGLIRVYIEISWPITKPYYVSSSNVFPRETRLFVREYFDPTFTDAAKE